VQQLTPELALLALRLIMVASIYALILWVALVARRSVDGRARGVAVQPRRLVVLAGAPDGPEPGLAIALQPRTTIGRGGDNIVVVPDPVVSARHASISSRGDRWYVEDLGSTNGTQVNDQWVSAPIAVAIGDEIQIGPARFRLAA
jgi:hypothetical protein